MSRTVKAKYCSKSEGRGASHDGTEPATYISFSVLAISGRVMRPKVIRVVRAPTNVSSGSLSKRAYNFYALVKSSD